MSLREIKNELYKKEPNRELMEHGSSEYNVTDVSFSSPEKIETPRDVWAEKDSSLGEADKGLVKKGAYILGGLLLVIALVVGFIKIKQFFFSENSLIILLTGPTEIKSGNLATYEISYKNANQASLKNVKLRLTYPEDFKPEKSADFTSEGTMTGVIDLGEIKGKSEGKTVFSGRAYSPKGNLIIIKAEISYTPSTVSSQFTASTQLAVNVLSAPLVIEVMAPQNISNDDEVNYLINYKNEGTEKLENIKIRIEYPEQFTFSKSEPRALEGNNTWYLGTLVGGQSGKIVATGKLGGGRDEVKTAKIMIGADSNGQFVAYNETAVQTKIVTSPLAIMQTVNGLTELNANAGNKLLFEITYKNEGTLGLGDVIVTERLDSPVLDYSTLELEGGAYDAGNKMITWKATDYAELKNLGVGQKGMIRFSINIKEVIPVANANDKNFVISSLAKIDSPDIPTPISMNKIISGNKMDIKLNSKLILDVKGYYNDGKISNTGPIPPKVGEETTYTMHFSVSNVSNDIEGAKVEAALPTSVTMTGKIFPDGSPLEYNERTNSIIWTIGKLDSGTGITSSGKEVAFQVKIKPSANQAGDEAPLLKESVFSARDLFTGENISAKVGGKSTKLMEDTSLGINYKVVN